ncbi:hypothetical protein [Acetobacter orientalis]|uniref:Uncharacterized protein n=1 Tax=Acetobacter orientalis TaxID=146474 RepID=A0A251ZZV4_9PROT|nr:hypothetical protein [Acetobacter orientalis]OUI80299.1 hypothetical protein HK12_09245 [Acetobacter orientalis]
MIMYINAAETMLALLGILIVVYGPLQAAIADALRQYLFEQRDELFEIAASGRISVNNAAYKAAREKINVSIRYAHRMSLPRTLFLMTMWKRKNYEIEDPLNLNLVRDEAVKVEIQCIMRHCARASAASLVFRSPAALIFFIAMAPLALLKAIFKDSRNFLANKITVKALYSILFPLWKILVPIEKTIACEISTARC